MLTSDLVRTRLKTRGDSLSVSWLDPKDPHWQRTAADLLRLFAAQVGRARGGWDAALDAYIGGRVDYTVIRGLAKVLEDAAEFRQAETAVIPADLRRHLFTHGAAFLTPDLFHPHTRADVLAGAAAELGITPEMIEAALFADRPAEQRLISLGAAWTPDSLIARYNLELARGVLYWAEGMQVEIHDSYKDFWKFVKLFKLMFWGAPLPGGGYSVALDGPISPFVAATTRYGRQFAAFLPALLLCERWQMSATVQPPGMTRKRTYRLDTKSALRTHFKRSGEFDSRLEADFAADFAERFGGTRGKWLLSREDEVLLLGDTVMIPDFSVTHKKSGVRVLIELVGFWTPEYLRRKVEKVRAAGRRDLLLLVYEGINLSPDRLADVPGEVLYFKNKPVLKDVMAAVERVAVL
jgi:predicted nuclease of restriction endonuclease-like RecB superfamily